MPKHDEHCDCGACARLWWSAQVFACDECRIQFVSMPDAQKHWYKVHKKDHSGGGSIRDIYEGVSEEGEENV